LQATPLQIRLGSTSGIAGNAPPSARLTILQA
jgi:hypothetical protein